jgi:hypothetical protein
MDLTMESRAYIILSVSADENKENIDIYGKHAMLLCKACFDLNVKIPTSGGSSNIQQKDSSTRKTEEENNPKNAVENLFIVCYIRPYIEGGM